MDFCGDDCFGEASCVGWRKGGKDRTVAGRGRFSPVPADGTWRLLLGMVDADEGRGAWP